ncbi:MAG TPA: L,D-transpeptidase family protein [Puia sp.]|nr:L,D-transpeptidase family protein [Puia sp.]
MKFLTVILYCLLAGFAGMSQRGSLTDRFYGQRQGRLFWFTPDGSAGMGCRQLVSCIDSAAWLGLDSNRYSPGVLRVLGGQRIVGEEAVMAADREYTDAALEFLMDVFAGAGVDRMVSYDGVSADYARRDEDQVLGGLRGPEDIPRLVEELQPVTAGYSTLKAAMRHALDSGGADSSARLSVALNLYRWIAHFHFDRFILVNIPSATLRYYVADTLTLRMRIVAGQISKRTPRFAAWVDGLVLYPYWNIPRRIATHELLPVFKKAPEAATLMDIQVLDSRGRKLDPGTIQWARYSAADFPYTLRQAPGCQNALGVLKFNVSSPYNVYMHDTNFKRAFGSSWRYLSHGCIRLEKPFLLGDLLLDHHLDTAMLNSCLRHQQPVPIALHPRVPFFVIYSTVEAARGGGLVWYKNVYHLRP